MCQKSDIIEHALGGKRLQPMQIQTQLCGIASPQRVIACVAPESHHEP